jgi:uncharacterized protein (DUF433 family)
MAIRGPVSTLREVERMLSSLPPAERAQVLQRIKRKLANAFPGVESRPDVCAGEPCIVGTHIPVRVLVQARRLGTSEADLLRAYPTLRAEDLGNAWDYYRAHPDEIDRRIRANEAT